MGFWGPVKEEVIAENPDFKSDANFGRDMFNVLIGTIAQTLLVLIPMYLIFQQTFPLYICIIILVICIALLKKFWWNNLSE
ncbi:hypothetical protein [Flavobacterium sediminis]|uniref:hypothetical protein n=1 Tax=Flavobacterium sediminis TaxID=2201181 RepID=UPI001FEB6B8C|nr:hypothetical protein [Flavobacterium sediminis]